MQRVRTLLLAAVAVLAIVGSQARAAFVDVSVQHSLVYLSFGGSGVRFQFHANFSSEQDRLVAVRCGNVEGTEPFYQNPFGTWTEPLGFVIPVIPELAYDTFVTIGLSSLQQGQTATVITPGSSFGAATFQAGWSAPVDAPYTHGPSVLIAQLTFSASAKFFLDLQFVLEWIDASGRMHESCMSLLSGWPVMFPCYAVYRADINHDCVVNGLDVALLLGEWDMHVDCGPFSPTFRGECPAGDMSCDGGVDGYDLAILLGEWGAVSDCQFGR